MSLSQKHIEIDRRPNDLEEEFASGRKPSVAFFACDQQIVKKAQETVEQGRHEQEQGGQLVDTRFFPQVKKNKRRREHDDRAPHRRRPRFREMFLGTLLAHSLPKFYFPKKGDEEKEGKDSDHETI